MSENLITIDGRKLEFTPEETILEVARRNGIFIPTLCNIKGAQPTGACRVCVVEIEGGRTLSPACATPASRNMVVHTNSPTVLDARRTILALLLQSGNHNCAVATEYSGEWTRFQQHVELYDQRTDLCPAHSACRLQAYAYRYQVDISGLVRVKTDHTMETASPLIVRDSSRCIMCGRCVEACNSIQVNNAISHGFRGAKAKIVAIGNDTLARSDCVFCGECIQACPVAALVERKSRYKIRPWEARHVRTTCFFCSVGCQLDLHIKNDMIMKVTGVVDAQPNQGRLCIKGRFGYDFVQSPDRLTRPMIRKNGELRGASWGEALDLIAEKIKETLEMHGPDAIAGICSAKSTNEALYTMQKLFRSAIGTNNLASPFAAGGLNRPIAEFEKAKRIIMIGSDVTEENPVAGTFIKRAAKDGCQLIVVDSRPTKIGTFADLNLILREGTESVFVNGIIKQLIERGRECADDIRETAESFSLDQVTESTGISADGLMAAVEILDTKDPVMLIYGSRVASFARTFIRLQEVVGSLDRKCGGVNYMGDLNNSQGACDMGMLPGFLPGFAMVDVKAARRPFEDAWGCKLNGKPGLRFGEMVRNIAGLVENNEQQIHFLYCVGENLAIARPAMPNITKALESVDFLVVQDILNNETVQHANVVLPAAAWSEEDGTYTNCERRVSRMRKAVPAPGEARPELWIFTQLANRLGQRWEAFTGQEIWENEITRLVPQLKGITYSSIESGGVQRPLSDPASLGLSGLRDKRSYLRRPGWTSFNYHHRTLLEHCGGLLESLPRSGGLGTQVPPSSPKEVNEKFLALLQEEERLDAKVQIDEILATYRHKRGGLIPVLQQVQEILGFLPVEVQNYIANGLGIPASDVFGVVTFYSFFTMVPRGRHTIRVCLGTACFVKGSGKLLETLARHLKVEVGQTTEDREYSLEVVRCIGACGLAPVMVIDDTTYGQVDLKEIVNIAESYRGASV
jgi:formate dehydrogenase major subunit